MLIKEITAPIVTRGEPSREKVVSEIKDYVKVQRRCYLHNLQLTGCLILFTIPLYIANYMSV